MPREIPSFTYEQVRGVIDNAVTVVSDLEIEGDLRVPAFSAACNLFAAKQIVMEEHELNPILRGIPLAGPGANADLRG